MLVAVRFTVVVSIHALGAGLAFGMTPLAAWSVAGLLPPLLVAPRASIKAARTLLLIYVVVASLIAVTLLFAFGVVCLLGSAAVQRPSLTAAGSLSLLLGYYGTDLLTTFL